MKKWIVGGLISAVIGIALGFGAVIAQDTNVWIGHMRFRQASPNVSFNGTLTFEKTDGTNLFQISQSGANIGASGTNVGQLRWYGQNISPDAICEAVSGNNCGALDDGGYTEGQAFTVTGLATTDVVFVNGPAPTAHCPMTDARVSNTNELTIYFTSTTGAQCIPATGFYRIWAMRT